MRKSVEAGTKVVEILKEEREKRGMSYYAFAKLIGASDMAVRYWEIGERIPKDLEVVNQILLKLNRTITLGGTTNGKRK